jgi:hypothetical protein
MTTGQREKIVYRVVVRGARSGGFLPPHGVGYGLGDDLGIVLNRTIKGPTRLRTSHRTVIGTVIAEDEDHITIERSDGQRFRIPVEDIIKRSASRTGTSRDRGISRFVTVVT